MSIRSFATAALVGLVTLAGCSSPDDAGRVDPIGPSDRDFAAVVRVLDYRCGSLDCHGTTKRNLRVYGFGGLRLDPTDLPDSPILPTPAEVNATYESVISLEPELMRAVTLAKGEGAERLTFVRKGRGTEDHKGGSRIAVGDDADICIQSWLRGAIDVAACSRVPMQF